MQVVQKNVRLLEWKPTLLSAQRTASLNTAPKDQLAHQNPILHEAHI